MHCVSCKKVSFEYKQTKILTTHTGANITRLRFIPLHPPPPTPPPHTHTHTHTHAHTDAHTELTLFLHLIDDLSKARILNLWKVDHDVRHVNVFYTRLRADLNILSTSRASKKQYETCPLCQSEPETVNHFILRCPFFQTERCHFFDCVKNFSPHLSMKSDLQKLAYILDLRCPPESIRVCCKYIYKVYTRRERCVIWNICIPSDIWLLLSVMSPWES